MSELKYTEKEKKLFSGRHDSLNILKKNIKANKKTFLIAPQGFGKRTLLKEFIQQTTSSSRYIPIYLDLEKTSISPESFAIEYLAAICSCSPNLNSLTQLKLDDTCKALIDRIDNELQKIRPDQKLILESAFSFPESYAKHIKKKLIIILNNYQDLTLLNNYAQITKVNELFLRTIGQQTTDYILSTTLTQKTTLETVTLKPLTKQESDELAEKILGKTDSRVKERLFSLTHGIPLVLKALCQQLKSRTEKSGSVSEQLTLLNRLFTKELVYRYSKTWTYCNDLYKTSMNNARGSSLLKILLKVLAEHDNLKLTEISRMIYRSAPVTKSLLERLIEVNLIERSGSTFAFTNPVLRKWSRLMFTDVEFDSVPEEKELDKTLQKIGGLQ